jgi:sulfite reductase alpha subunit-like flavoprotein
MELNCRLLSIWMQEWKALMGSGVLKPDLGLICAFSRDQPSKRYVQHCIREHKQLLWHILRDENATVFVAGAAEKMPEAVASAFVDVIAAGLQCPEAEAKALQRRLEAAKRYCVEAWS